MGLFAAMSLTTTTLIVTQPEDERGVRPVKQLVEPGPRVFSRDESTGLFVGVRTFPHDDALEVPYAVDDAVDLAYKFSLDQRSSLIPPRRVVLALSGRPQKQASKDKLRELRKAGAEVQKATSGDILHLLNDQVDRAGKNGLFVLSLATHGFLDERGDAYILGSTSQIGSTETSLPTAAILDKAQQTARALVFIDACRDRIGTGARGAAPDPTTAAPLLSKMGNIEGMVVFYAAAPDGYAFDDEVRQNGVFTAAVLDGLDCQASAPRGEVIAETLHTYVERQVHSWIRDRKKAPDGPVTQVSMEGNTRSMPLAQCWRSPKFPIRAAIDGTVVRAYDMDTKPLWQKDLHTRILRATPVDLDADAFYEVVVGTGDGIFVFDRDGKERWRHTGDGRALADFAVGDLFRKHTNQIVALWTGEHTSQVTVLDSEANERTSGDYTGRLQNVLVLRPTNMHNAIIVAASADRLFAIDARKLSTRWSHILTSPADAIRDLDILARDSRWRDIAVMTKNGITLFDFEGTIRSARAEWIEVKKQNRP
jgi:hypothetical protein